MKTKRTTGRQVKACHASAWALGLLLCLASLGCESVRFYGQAVSGQVGLLWRREAIEKLLASEELSQAERSTLELTEELKDFAQRELGLPTKGAYTSYVRLERDFVVWNVAVCPEFDVEPKSWWYPIVGRLEHRGYFREKSALRYGALMERRGYDVAVGGVEAYSTLGWFSDPVLSTFVGSEETDLAELFFHELAHRELFIAGDTDYNEAYAVALAEYGVSQWLLTNGTSESWQNYRDEVLARDVFFRRVSALREALAVIYTKSGRTGSDLASLRSAKFKAIESFRDEFRNAATSDPRLERYLAWVEGPIDNARISALDTYYRLVPLFRQLLADSESVESFYSRVREIGRMPRSEREGALRRRAITDQRISNP